MKKKIIVHFLFFEKYYNFAIIFWKIEMEYYKEFFESKKSKSGIFYGIFITAVALFLIIIEYLDNGSFSSFDWMLDKLCAAFGITNEPSSSYPFHWYFSFALLVIGILQIFSGFGKPIQNIIGKAYLKINEQAIVLKRDIWIKTDIIHWDNVAAIEYKAAIFFFELNNKALYKLPIEYFDYSEIQKIKEVIKEIASRKNVSITQLIS